MLIPLASSTDSGSVPEWVLVELQGRVEPMQEEDLRQTLHIGTMQLSKTNKDVVTLQIGYHILEGRKVALKKPMAILETLSSSSSGCGTDGSQDPRASLPHHSTPPPGGAGCGVDGGSRSSSGAEGSDGGSSTYCKVIGVLRHKYLFKTRPKALISKPQGR